MDEYNAAVQTPAVAFADPELKRSAVLTNNLGLPMALGGGFALTYTAQVGATKYAIRCFHKEVAGLGDQYRPISAKLGALGSDKFVAFQYFDQGILVNGNRFPLVKMAWAEGDVLGAYLELKYRDKGALTALRNEFIRLEGFLSQNGLAHGDLQNGNVMVGPRGITLIDYDGMFVAGMKVGAGKEIGHKHFQHPKRSEVDFGPHMDRFSLIAIDIGLRGLVADPGLFKKYSTGENIVFVAEDYRDPANSPAFSELKKIQSLTSDVQHFADICVAPLSVVPTLEDFLAGRNLPSSKVVISATALQKPIASRPPYVGVYPVVNGNNYPSVVGYVGSRVELVGLVNKVRGGVDKRGGTYCLVFFRDGDMAVSLTIFPAAVARMLEVPDDTWVGKWLSVQGLVEPPYIDKNDRVSISINISSSSEFRDIGEPAARYRLDSKAPTLAPSATAPRRAAPTTPSSASSGPAGARQGLPSWIPTGSGAPTSRNAAIVARQQAVPRVTTGTTPSSPRAPASGSARPSYPGSARPPSRVPRVLLIAAVALVVAFVLILLRR